MLFKLNTCNIKFNIFSTLWVPNICVSNRIFFFFSFSFFGGEGEWELINPKTPNQKTDGHPDSPPCLTTKWFLTCWGHLTSITRPFSLLLPSLGFYFLLTFLHSSPHHSFQSTLHWTFRVSDQVTLFIRVLQWLINAFGARLEAPSVTLKAFQDLDLTFTCYTLLHSPFKPWMLASWTTRTSPNVPCLLRCCSSAYSLFTACNAPLPPLLLVFAYSCLETWIIFLKKHNLIPSSSSNKDSAPFLVISLHLNIGLDT